MKILVKPKGLYLEGSVVGSKSSKGRDRGWEGQLPRVKARTPPGVPAGTDALSRWFLPSSTTREFFKKSK